MNGGWALIKGILSWSGSHGTESSAQTGQRRTAGLIDQQSTAQGGHRQKTLAGRLNIVIGNTGMRVGAIELAEQSGEGR